MLNKNTIIFFFALTIGLLAGFAFPLFSDDKGTFVEELQKSSNIIGALVGGTVGALAMHYFGTNNKS